MRAQTKARSFHFFARRRGGVVQVQTERFFFVIDPPPRAHLVLIPHPSWLFGRETWVTSVRRHR
jgi:hypothetical protein